MAFILGVGTALTIKSQGHGILMKQTASMLKPVVVVGNTASTINNIFLVVGAVTGLLYFTFTRERTGALDWVGKIGKVFLLVMFGANFGRVAMTRFATDINRIEAIILTDAIWLVPIFFIILIAYIIYGQRKTIADTSINTV